MMNGKITVPWKYKLPNMQHELRTIIVVMTAKNRIQNVRSVMVTNCKRLHIVCSTNAVRIAQDNMNSKNFYAFNPAFDKKKK